MEDRFVLRVSPTTNSAQHPQLAEMQRTLPNSPTLEFSVSYSLSEYLSIVQDHYPSALASYYSRRGKSLKRITRLTTFVLIMVGSVMFFFNKRRMPVCHFTINGERIKRVTQDGILEFPWTGVVAVHRYKQGFLIQKSRGAVPLPYRCLTKDQRTLLEVFIQRWSDVRR